MPPQPEHLIALAAQAKERFSELENIEWRVNFATWGFLVFVIYFNQKGDLQFGGRWSYALAIVPFLQLAFLITINRQMAIWNNWAHHYRGLAKDLMSLPCGGKEKLTPPTGQESVSIRIYWWVLLELLPSVAATIFALAKAK